MGVLVKNLAGKTALVTGAGRGIGAACAAKLAAAGARVMINDIDADVAEAQARKLAGAEALACDLTEEDAGERCIQAAVECFGGLDIVVNNAGYIWNGAIHRSSDEQWHAMLDVHATAQFRLLRAYGRWLRSISAAGTDPTDQLGHTRKVVNVSSVSGTMGAATQVGYSAAKAAVVGMTKSLAKEWGRYNVTVNAVAFGLIDTRLTAAYEGEPNTAVIKGAARNVGLTSQQRELARRASPLGRLGSPEDAANSIYLLCIPESDWITGEVLTASGGVRS